MASYDPEMAARVWQRVQGNRTSVADAPALQELIAQEWVDSAVCRRLSRHFSGKDSAVLRQIALQKQSNVACLKGICSMLTGSQPAVPKPPVPRESPLQSLRSCCEHGALYARHYEALSGDSRFGQEYARLAQRAAQHQHQLLALLGKLKTSKKT